MKVRWAALTGALLLAGCAQHLVDVPTTRAPAAVVALDGEVARCPPGTVLLGDEDPASGAGAVPAGFVGDQVLRCFVDHSTATTKGGVETMTVAQWQGPMTADLRAAIDLPDRELRPGGGACGASFAGTTAVYLVDAQDRAVRVLLPTDEPCQQIREEVQRLLPDDGPAVLTFRASRAG